MSALKFKSIPDPSPLAAVYIIIVVTLSLLTLYIRSQSYAKIVLTQPGITFDVIVIPALQLVPNQSLFNPWTFLSEPFVETNIFKFFVSVGVLYFGITYLEKHWSLNNDTKLFSEVVYFIAVVSFATNFSTVLIKFVIGLLSGDVVALSLPVNHGFYSIIMSFVVVLKQLSPEHNIKLPGDISIRMKQVPFILICLTVVISVSRMSISPIVPIFTNFYISWFYLRYYQINNLTDLLPSSSNNPQQSSVRGDASDTFAFIQFFPDSLQSSMKPVCRLFYHSSVFLGIIRPFNDDDVESGNLRTIKRLNTKVGTVTGEASDRRRQVALKVLGDRVVSGVGSPSTPAPSSFGSAAPSASITASTGTTNVNTEESK